MSEFLVCEQCQRHMRIHESACPFCGQAASSRRGPVRAALFAGALVGASAFGCSDSKPKAEAPPVVDTPTVAVSIDAAPAVIAQSDAAAPDPVDAGVADAAAVKKKKRKQKVEVKTAIPVERLPPMPYGAPPARRRLV